MKNKIDLKFLTLCLAVFLTVFSCKAPPKFNEAALHGKWVVTSWVEEASGKEFSNKMDMTYQSDSLYSIDYGPKKEEGKYWIEDEFLHTVATGKSENKVKIISINAETLKIQMNRGGKMENVVLTKK